MRCLFLCLTLLNHVERMYALFLWAIWAPFWLWCFFKTKFDRQKMMWLKFDMLDFRDFLPNGLEGIGLKAGPVFCGHPVVKAKTLARSRVSKHTHCHVIQVFCCGRKMFQSFILCLSSVLETISLFLIVFINDHSTTTSFSSTSFHGLHTKIYNKTQTIQQVVKVA